MKQKYENKISHFRACCITLYPNCYVCLQIVSMSEVLVPVVMMFVLCIVHSHIVSTHSGPTMLSNQSRQRITRRSRHVRCRNGKSRHRQNLRKYVIVIKILITKYTLKTKILIYFYNVLICNKYSLKVYIRIQNPLKILSLRKQVQEVKKY